MLNLLQVQNTCERLAVRHWPQQEVSVYTVTKDCIATYLPRRARFRKPGTDTMDMIGDHLAVTSWRWKLCFSTLRDHFFFIFRVQTHNPQSLRRQLQGPALWKNNKKQCGRAASWQNPTTSYLCIQKTLQCHKSGTQPVGTMILIPQGEASARGVPGASLHWALKIIFYSTRLVTEDLSSHAEPIREVRTRKPRREAENKFKIKTIICIYVFFNI